MTIQDKKDFAKSNFEECRSLRKIITHQGKGIVSFTSIEKDPAVAGMAVEIAKALQQQHFKVLIIDTNTVHPEVHEWFMLKNDKGILSEFIEDSASISVNTVSVLTDGDNALDVLPCETAPNQRDFLSSNEFKNKILMFKSNYDYVILCLPPIKDNYETQELISISDQTYAIVHMLENEFTDVSKALQNLQLAGNQLDGWVMVNRKSKEYPYFERLFKWKSK